MAVRPLTEIGLEQSAVPDLTDPRTRERLSPPAIAAFFKITELWDLNNETAMAMLGGVSNGRYYELKRKRKGLLTQDELTRVSLLIGIFKSLNILFSRKLANEWISRPNSNPMFNYAAPQVLLTHGGMPGMISVRRLLDGRRGGR